MIFARLALRNVMRNMRRSAISVLAIAVGTAALLFVWAFADGTNDQMIENSTRYVSGHLQIHRKGYHEDQTLDRTLSDRAPVLAAVQGTAASAASRLEGNALASVGEKSRGVAVMGIEPVAEKAVTTLEQTVMDGTFLQAGDNKGIVLGLRIAEALNAKVGGEVVLVTQAADGSVGAGRYTVRGIFRTRMDMLDGVYVLLTLGAAQELYATGDAITSVVLRLNDRAQAKSAKARLESAIGADHEILDWEQLLPAVVQSVAFHEVTGYVLVLVLFVVVAVGITNTVLMGVMERTREFGVMMALGTTRTQLVRLIFSEAALLGVAGLVLGIALGMGIVNYYAAVGMDFSRYTRAMETMQGLSASIYPLPRWDRGLLISASVLVIALAAALYPALRAARLVPIAAIRGLADEEVRWWAGRTRTFRQPRLVFPLLLRLAGRSIGRNPRRTALTIAASAFGVGAFVFIIGIADGYLAQLVENSTGYVTGHLQVQHPGFRTEMEPANSIADDGTLVHRLRTAAGVAAAAPRVQSMALATSASQSQNFVLVGIEPGAESRVTFMHRAVRTGRMLAGGEREIVLGDRLAEKLGLRVGDKVVVMAGGTDGNVGSAAYRLVGLLDTGSDSFDAMLGYVSLRSARELLGLDGRLSAVAIRLEDPQALAQARLSLAKLVPPGQAVVVTWRDLLPEVDQMIEYLRVVLGLITAIVLAVVAIGVMNTLLMSVMERTRELGIMMALGTRPRAIVALVLYESLVLALVGILAGLILGVPIVEFLSRRGLDLSRYAGGLQTIPGLTGIIYPVLVPANLLRPGIVLLALSMIAALYPAWRAARLEPTQAIRHV